MILGTAHRGTDSKVVAERGDCPAERTGDRRHEQGGKLIDILRCVTSFAESFTLAMSQMRVVSLETVHR